MKTPDDYGRNPGFEAAKVGGFQENTTVEFPGGNWHRGEADSSPGFRPVPNDELLLPGK
jgi:hypothetical protein